MSGIYIPGMELPITCCHCPLMGYDPDREWFDSMAQTGAHICVLTGALIDNTKREEHCPLVPVPDHGRLVDGDKIVEGCKDEDGRYISQFAAVVGETVEAAPTVIPADKEAET